jgi:hypothetical protein
MLFEQVGVRWWVELAVWEWVPGRCGVRIVARERLKARRLRVVAKGRQVKRQPMLLGHEQPIGQGELW